MIKKLLCLLVLLMTVVSGAWAQTQWTSGDCTVTLSNGTLTFSGKGAMDDYQPPTNRPWDGNKGDITSVVVESGVTTVGALSFCNFGKLTSVTLPEGLTSIGTRSFLSCGKLTSITIPSTVTSIGADAFYSCTSVTDVNLYADPANLTWNEDGCDDFNRDVMGSTKCHVLAEYLSAYETKFSEKINVTFVGDLKPLTPAATTYSITLAEDTEDADKWSVKVGEKAAAFPVEGLEGGETITATYNGTKKVKSVKAVKKGGAVDLKAVPLTIEAITAGNISVSSPKEGMQYSLNGGAKTTMTANPTTIEVAVGDKVQFYGKGTTIICYDGTVITGSGDGFTCKVYGNIMSLVDEENFATATTLSQSFTFFELFYENTTLTDASSLLLPAETLANGCYRQMFWGCTALTAAPALPAETLVTSCYNQMFRGCTSLTTAPVLPAPTLVTSCYYNMFYGCSKLATVTCRATSGFNATMCTENWLKNAGTEAEGTKTFNAVSTAEWPSGNAGIPDGWTRVNVDN